MHKIRCESKVRQDTRQSFSVVDLVSYERASRAALYTLVMKRLFMLTASSQANTEKCSLSVPYQHALQLLTNPC